MLSFVYCSYENFMGTTSEVVCPYGINGLTGVFGENGNGKSTQIEAMTFALFGSGIRSPYKTDYINSKVKGNTVVKCKFIFKSDTYEIERYMNHASEKNAVKLYKNGSELTFKNTKDVTSYIENNICSKDIFIKTCIFPQKSTDTFISLKSSDRFKLFSEIINLDIYDKYYKVAANNLKEYQASADDIIKHLESLNDKLNDINNLKESYINEIESENEKIKSHIFSIEKQNNSIEDSIKNIGFENYEQFESEMKSTETFIQSLDKLKDKAKMDLDKNISIADNIFNNNTNDLKNKLNKIETDISDEINNEIEKFSNKIFNRKSEIDELLSEHYQRLNSKIENIRREYDNKIIDTESEINKLKDGRIKTLNENKIKVETQKNSLFESLNDINNKLNALDNMSNDSTCPVCKRPLDESCKDALISEKNRVENEINNLGEVHNKLLIDIKKEEDLIESLMKSISDDRNKSEREIEGYNNKIKSVVSGLQNEKGKLTNDLENIRSNVTERVNEKYDKIKNKIKFDLNEVIKRHNSNKETLEKRYNETIYNLHKQEEEYKDRLSTLLTVNDKYSTINENITKIKNISENIRKVNTNDYDKKISETKNEIDEEAKRKAELNDSIIPMAKFVKEMFSDRGIKNYIIGRLLPEINTRVNKYLERTRSNHRIQVDNIKELKSGNKKKNEIFIKFFTNGIEKPINMASGGEQRLLDVIFFMVFYDIFSAQNSFNTNVLYFDEIFDSLDEKRCDAVFDLLKIYADRLDVRVISHSDTWKSKDFDDVITVE